MRRQLLVLMLSVLFLGGCAYQRPDFKGDTETEQFRTFLDWSFDHFIEKQPEDMAYLGIEKKQDQLNSFSAKFYQTMQDDAKKHLKILRSFDKDELSKEDQLSYALYEIRLQQKIDELRWNDYGYPVNQMFGIQSTLPSFMMSIHRVKTEQDLKNYLARLKEFRRVFGEVVNNLMRSETKGVVLPKFVFEKVIDDSKNIVSGRPFVKSKQDSPLFKDMKQKINKLKLKKNKRAEYLKQGKAALLNSVGPAYADLIAFLEKQEKRATTEDGVWKFPKGESYYQYRLKKMTTTDLSADEIHALGLKNVARIHDEMSSIQKKVKFKGSLQDFFKHMQSKKFLFADNKKGKAQYLKKAKGYIAAMKKRLDSFFITKPKADIVVKAVEPFREKSAGMAFYNTPTADGSRPGTYYVNLYNMEALPTWEAEALAYHEGIPGHHMQFSIAQELNHLPKFRRFGHYSSYVEGWGLYSERFPKDHGFYNDPYSDFGRLSMELTRACRLVVDTGIHHLKWSREKAIAYLDKNLPGDHADNVRQINRYIIMPGQATAYMVGLLKILELKKKAKKQLGSGFDIREFHEVILTNGPVPLTILEELIDDWIKSKS